MTDFAGQTATAAIPFRDPEFQQTQATPTPVPTGYARGIAETNRIYNSPRNLRDDMCSPNNHSFECKHEITCYCGMTLRRTELELPRGI